MDNVIGRDDSTELKKALIDQGIEDIFDLVTLDDPSIDSLMVKDSSKPPTMVPVKKGDRNLLNALWHTRTCLIAKTSKLTILA